MDVHQIEATAWTALKGLSASKKFQAAVLSIIAWAVGKAGFHMDTAELIPYISPLWLFIFGQGLADIGKSAAQATAISNAVLFKTATGGSNAAAPPAA